MSKLRVWECPYTKYTFVDEGEYKAHMAKFGREVDNSIRRMRVYAQHGLAMANIRATVTSFEELRQAIMANADSLALAKDLRTEAGITAAALRAYPRRKYRSRIMSVYFTNVRYQVFSKTWLGNISISVVEDRYCNSHMVDWFLALEINIGVGAGNSTRFEPKKKISTFNYDFTICEDDWPAMAAERNMCVSFATIAGTGVGGLAADWLSLRP